jgi:hypothetical protein
MLGWAGCWCCMVVDGQVAWRDSDEDGDECDGGERIRVGMETNVMVVKGFEWEWKWIRVEMEVNVMVVKGFEWKWR